jgi:hypothetical protein
MCTNLPIASKEKRCHLNAEQLPFSCSKKKLLAMKNKAQFRKIILASLLGLINFTMPFAQPRVEMVNFKANSTYRIGSNSVLKLDGKTNINTFSCNCTESFAPQVFSLKINKNEPNSAAFQHTLLKIPVKSLDCGNKVMNKDMYKALNSEDYPYITIELLEIKQDKCNKLGELKDWLQIKALARISLNGHSQEYWLNVTAKKLGTHLYRFIGSKQLNMSAFGIAPPVAMMGVIKVKDEIKIDLDLEVSIEQ